MTSNVKSNVTDKPYIGIEVKKTNRETFGDTLVRMINEEIDCFISKCNLGEKEKNIIRDYFFDGENNTWFESIGPILGLSKDEDYFTITKIIFLTSQNKQEIREYKHSSFLLFNDNSIPINIISTPDMPLFIMVYYKVNENDEEFFFIFPDHGSLNFFSGESISLLVPNNNSPHIPVISEK